MRERCGEGNRHTRHENGKKGMGRGGGRERAGGGTHGN